MCVETLTRHALFSSQHLEPAQVSCGSVYSQNQGSTRRGSLKVEWNPPNRMVHWIYLSKRSSLVQELLRVLSGNPWSLYTRRRTCRQSGSRGTVKKKFKNGSLQHQKFHKRTFSSRTISHRIGFFGDERSWGFIIGSSRQDWKKVLLWRHALRNHTSVP